MEGVFLALVFGVFSFLLFFCYDCNQLTGNRPFFRPLFGMGCLLLAGSTLHLIWRRSGTPFLSPPLAAAAWALSLLMAALTAYSLFFALPFGSTYLTADNRKTYTAGVYALCRHPGVLFLAGFYGALWLATGDASLGAAFVLFDLCNVLYALFQDRVTFPRQFDDYPQYRGTTPFLIPNPASLRRACTTLRKEFFNEV